MTARRASLADALATPQGGRPALRHVLRRPAAAVAAVSATGLGLLSIAFAGSEGPSLLDTWIDDRIRYLFVPWAELLQSFITLGSPQSVAISATLLAVSCLALRRVRLALVVVLGSVTAGVLAVALQALISRSTVWGGLALPSGHSAGMTAIAMCCALVALSLTDSRPGITATVGMGVLGVSGVFGIALVTNHHHYVTDAVAGSCLSISVLLSLARAVDAICERTGRARQAGVRGGPT